MRYSDIYRLHKKAAKWYDPFNLFTEEDALLKLLKLYQLLLSQYSRLDPNSPLADALYKQLRENMLATQNEKARRDIISSRQQEAWGNPLYAKPRSWILKFSDNVKGIFDPDIQGNINKLRDTEEQRIRTAPSVNTLVTQQDLDDYFKAQQTVLRGPATPSTAPIARPVAATTPAAVSAPATTTVPATVPAPTMVQQPAQQATIEDQDRIDLMDQNAMNLTDEISNSKPFGVDRATLTKVPPVNPQISYGSSKVVPKPLKPVPNTGVVKPIDSGTSANHITKQQQDYSKQHAIITENAQKARRDLRNNKRYTYTRPDGVIVTVSGKTRDTMRDRRRKAGSEREQLREGHYRRYGIDNATRNRDVKRGQQIVNQRAEQYRAANQRGHQLRYVTPTLKGGVSRGQQRLRGF